MFGTANCRRPVPEDESKFLAIQSKDRIHSERPEWVEPAAAEGLTRYG